MELTLELISSLVLVFIAFLCLEICSAGNHEGRLQVVQYHSRREGPQFVFLDLGFVFKILMRNGSRFRIESMHLECGIPNNQDHGIGQKFQFWAVIKFLDLEIRVGACSRWALI